MAAIEAHEVQKLSVERQAEAANMAKTTAAKRLAMEASVLNAKADIEAAKAAAGIAAANLEEVKAKAALMRASGQTFSFRKMLTAATQQATLAANALTAAEQRLAAVTLEAGTTQRIATLDAQALTLATQGATVAATEAAIANKAVTASSLEAAAAQKAAAAANMAVALTMKELFSFNTLLNGAMATFIGYEVGSYIREWAKETKAGAIAFEAFDQWLRYLSDDYDQLIRVERDHAKTLKAQSEQLRAVEVHTGLVYKSQKELMAAVEDGLVLWNSQTKQWERGVDAAKKLAQGLGTIDTAYARSIEILDEYAKVQKDAGDLRVNQAKHSVDMAKALGDERTGLIASNEAKQVALDVARETVTMEAALLARTQERLDQLTRETAFTKGAASAKADQIKGLTEEIQKRQLAYEKAKLQAGQAEIEVEQARATAESYGDQADQLDTLIQRREALTMSLQAYEQVAAEGNVTLAEYEALQNKSIEAANRLGDAYNRQAYDEIPALTVEVQALQKRVMDLRETIDLGRIAEEKAVNVRQQLANVTARLKDSSKDSLDRIERESAALKRSTDLRSSSLKLMKQDLDARADAAEALEKELQAMELRNMQGQVEVEQLRVSADAKRKEADLLAQKATALAKVGAATGEYTDAEQAQAQASFDAAAAARIEADGITNLANAKAKLAEQNIRLAESGTIQLRQAAEAANREAEASARYADIEDKRLQVLKDQTEARKAHAITVGDDVAAQKAAVDVAKLEVTIAERAAAGKREQARLLAEEANLREVSYLASQKSNRETEASIVALRDAAEMASLEADALDVTVQVKKEAVTQTEKLNAAEIKLFSSMDLVLKQIELYASAQEKAFAAKNEMVGVSLALAEAEGKEAEALALKVTKKENDLNLAEQSLKYEETALTLMERKLAILQSTAVTTDAERKKRDQDMALLSGEIALKRQEVEAAGARIEMTKTEMTLAKEAAAQYGDQSGALTKLVNQHSKLSSELARLTEARKAGALASQEIEAAEAALAAIEVKLNEEIPKTAEEQRALNHEYESAKLTVDLLTQAIYDGILADQSAVPIKEKLGEITRALADAAKDAIANIDAEIVANERALSLSQARLTLDSDWNALMATRAKVRGDDVRAQELAIDVMKNEAEATRLASEAKERDSMLLAQKAKTMEIAARANGEYTLSEQRQVKQAEAVAEMAGIEAERMAVLAQTKKEVAEQTEALVAREERLRAAFTDAGVAGVKTFSDIRSAISSAASGSELEALREGLESAIQAGVDKAGELSAALADVQAKMEGLQESEQTRTFKTTYEDMFRKYGTDMTKVRQANAGLSGEQTNALVEWYTDWLREQGFFGGPRPKSRDQMTAREVAAAEAEAESRAAPAQQGYRRVVDINLRGAGETATVTAASEDEAERVIRVLRAAQRGAT